MSATVSCSYAIAYLKVSGLRAGTFLRGFGKHCTFATEKERDEWSELFFKNQSRNLKKEQQ